VMNGVRVDGNGRLPASPCEAIGLANLTWGLQTHRVRVAVPPVPRTRGPQGVWQARPSCPLGSRHKAAPENLSHIADLCGASERTESTS